MDNEARGIGYKKITVEGIVQGVGFRPQVYRLAQKFNILGTVKNTGGAVEICSAGTEENLSLFFEAIRNNDIPFARIERIEMIDINCFTAEEFTIIDSGNNSLNECFISPDLAACAKCISESEDHTNRRYNHYFNTCVSCGPRFSVVEKLPYDRENTAMREFHMCEPCQAEYNSANNRRFHAETISCNDCGPYLLYQTNHETYVGSSGFFQAIDALKKGGIIAIKGIGGYHFACSPFVSNAVASLRNLKGRDKKSFAVMFRDIEEIKKCCEVSFEEQELLQSNPHPITLLTLKDDCLGDNHFVHQVLFEDLRCGCFLPYTPMHHMLMKHMGLLIMTSANVSGSSIIKDDREMIALLNDKSEMLWGVLYHERKIVRSIEDSVANMVGKGQVQIIRRARGYVPAPFYIDNRNKYSLLAMGGDLKSSFCFVKNNHAYMSQYFGDLEDLGVNKVYTSSINEYKALFHIEPQFVLCDLHPQYFSSNHAKSLGLPIVFVQHHHAHIASVMAEHKIEGKVIGVAFDGSGYGTDGSVWGGEFLICEGKNCKRAGHIQYTNILGGDSSAQDAKKTADCFLYDHELDHMEAFDGRFNLIKSALNKNINTIQSSSMGRLFDAVASILGICHENSYEGQCAIYLQRSAERAYRDKIEPYFMEFGIRENKDEILICHGEIIKTLYEQSYVKGNADNGAYALGFHMAVANMINTVCIRLREKEGINQIALSGGVFQNSFLIHLCLDLLEDKGFQTFINNETPPNDSAISLGQAYIGVNMPGMNKEEMDHVHCGSNGSDRNRPSQ